MKLFFFERQTTVSARPWTGLPKMWPIFRDSFVTRIAGDKPVMDLSLTFADGSEFSKQVLDSTVCDGGEITYIADLIIVAVYLLGIRML